MSQCQDIETISLSDKGWVMAASLGIGLLGTILLVLCGVSHAIGYFGFYSFQDIGNSNLQQYSWWLALLFSACLFNGIISLITSYFLKKFKSWAWLNATAVVSATFLLFVWRAATAYTDILTYTFIFLGLLLVALARSRRACRAKSLLNKNYLFTFLFLMFGYFSIPFACFVQMRILLASSPHRYSIWYW